MKNCISCNMPLNGELDFALRGEVKEYCIYCSRADGSMKSFDEAKESMIKYVIKTHDLTPKEAEKGVLIVMKKLPAWKNNFT
ncbi:MAG: zinc ribbon domain-containing protein [Nitrososphaerota archaeon]|nr:zinc ribbon domain-containing protein [Nitrososphaerota archaeon]